MFLTIRAVILSCFVHVIILFLAPETSLNLPLNNLQWFSLVSVGKEEHSGRTGVGLVSPWAVTRALVMHIFCQFSLQLMVSTFLSVELL